MNFSASRNSSYNYGCEHWKYGFVCNSRGIFILVFNYVTGHRPIEIVKNESKLDFF